MNSKSYRCGHCGTPTDENGNPLAIDKCNELSEDQLNGAELVHGYCCPPEQEPERVCITRDMALDACDPSLEGQYTNW